LLVIPIATDFLLTNDPYLFLKVDDSLFFNFNESGEREGEEFPANALLIKGLSYVAMSRFLFFLGSY